MIPSPRLALDFSNIRPVLRNALLVLFPFLAAVASATDLRREVERAAGGRDAPGIVLILARAGHVETLAVAGFADRSRRLPLSAEHRWPLGESSRLLTGLLAAELAEAGIVDLDRPLSDWLSPAEIDFDPEALTLRDLLAHRSGLPPARLAGAYRRLDDPPVGLAPEDFYLAQPPRLLIQPSSLAYVLIGRALERNAGRPLSELIRVHLAEPLGLGDLGPIEAALPVVGHRRGRAQEALLPRDQAANGLAASARDLARLLAALTAAQPPYAGAHRLFEPHQARLGFGAKTGLGPSLIDSIVPGTGRLASFESAYPGIRGRILFALDHGVAVAVLVNAAEGFRTVERLSDLALDQALGRDPAARAEARRLRERAPATMPWPEGAERTVPAGRYLTPFGLLSVETAGSGFRAEVFGFRFSAEAREDGWYRVRYRLLGVVPIGFEILDRVLLAPAVLDGKHYLLAALGQRVFLLGSALEAPSAPVAARALLGRWRVVSEDPLLRDFEIRQAEVIEEEGLLSLRYELPFFVFTLKPRMPIVSENGHWKVAGTGPGLGERLRFGRDEEGDFLEYSGFKLRRVP